MPSLVRYGEITMTTKDQRTERVTHSMPVRAAEKPAQDPSRIDGAYFLGGAWYAADGSPLTAPEAQQAHRAMDAKAAEARRLALLGRSE